MFRQAHTRACTTTPSRPRDPHRKHARTANPHCKARAQMWSANTETMACMVLLFHATEHEPAATSAGACQPDGKRAPNAHIGAQREPASAGKTCQPCAEGRAWSACVRRRVAPHRPFSCPRSTCCSSAAQRRSFASPRTSLCTARRGKRRSATRGGRERHSGARRTALDAHRRI
jgi:hypothetical protein